MRLYYDHNLNLYVFECYPSEKDIPKSIGFTYNPIKINKKAWYTSDYHVALKLSRYADDETRAILDAELKVNMLTAKESSRKFTSAIYTAPAGLNYYPFQSAGIEYLINHHKVLLADEVGCGKGIQTIGLINNTNIKKVLIVCPNTLKLNWKLELEKWLCKNLSVSVIYANKYQEADIMVINYDILSKYTPQLTNIIFDLIVCDESHALKNSKTERFEAYKKISKNIPRKLFITGTPILNRPVELWTTIQELCPQQFGNYYAFGKEFCDGKKEKTFYDRKNNQQNYRWNFDGASNLDKLQLKLKSTCLLRRLKKDVLTELPSITRQIIILENELIQNSEQKESESVKKEYSDQVNELKLDSLGLFRQLSEIRHQTALRKVPYVIDFVLDLLEETDKVIIFAHHKDVIEKLRVAFVDSVIVTGGMSVQERQKSIELFQTDPKTKVFIGSIQASGTGITLTASSTVVFAELDWVPANITQCEGRASRIGQKNAITAYHLVFNNTIDAHLAKTIVRKQEIVDKSLDVPVNLKEIFGF